MYPDRGITLPANDHNFLPHRIKTRQPHHHLIEAQSAHHGTSHTVNDDLIPRYAAQTISVANRNNADISFVRSYVACAIAYCQTGGQTTTGCQLRFPGQGGAIRAGKWLVNAARGFRARGWKSRCALGYPVAPASTARSALCRR